MFVFDIGVFGILLLVFKGKIINGKFVVLIK